MAELREPLPPAHSGWLPLTCPSTVEGLAKSAWASGPVWVISTLVDAELPDGAGLGLQWHVSVSRKGKRPKDTDVRRALRAFGLVGAEEDNHHPGNARHFWRPVDPAHRVDCECKATEEQVTDPDGYRWSNDRQECRGCQIASWIGRPCPVHSAVALRKVG